jgi:hypothetical protein
MQVPIIQVKGQRSSVQLRSLVRYHTGQQQSLYDVSYEGRNDAPPRLLGYYIPPFQRPEVWYDSQKSRFIESIFLGFDLGRIVVSSDTKDNGTDGWLIDGQQRLTAIRDFIDSKITIFNDISYSDILEPGFDYDRSLGLLGGPGPKGTPADLWGETWLDVLVLRDASLGLLENAYLRMNYGGTPHTAAHMPKTQAQKRKKSIGTQGRVSASLTDALKVIMGHMGHNCSPVADDIRVKQLEEVVAQAQSVCSVYPCSKCDSCILLKDALERLPKDNADNQARIKALENVALIAIGLCSVPPCSKCCSIDPVKDALKALIPEATDAEIDVQAAIAKLKKHFGPERWRHLAAVMARM